MFKNFILCLFIVIFIVACAAHGDRRQHNLRDMAKESTAEQEQTDIDEFRPPDEVSDSDWHPFKGVLLRHIVANCCFSESENTVILGQDNNRDQVVDKCYQLKGREGDLYYRTIECPDNLVPVTTPRKDNRLHCSLN